MVTAHDKAIIAAIMGVIGLTNSFGLTHFGLDEHTVTMFVTTVVPILVWLIPNNKPVDPTAQQAGGR